MTKEVHMLQEKCRLDIEAAHGSSFSLTCRGDVKEAPTYPIARLVVVDTKNLHRITRMRLSDRVSVSVANCRSFAGASSQLYRSVKVKSGKGIFNLAPQSLRKD